MYRASEGPEMWYNPEFFVFVTKTKKQKKKSYTLRLMYEETSLQP